MSLMTVSSASADDLTIRRYSRCSDVSSVSSTRSVMPMTPFIGVRISWLMFARNSLLARLAASATFLAVRRLARSSARSVCVRT